MANDLIERAKNDAWLSRATKDPCEHKRAELMEEMIARIEALQAENARLREATEQAFMEGFGVAAAMSPYIHEVMCEREPAWLSSRTRAALQQDKEGE